MTSDSLEETLSEAAGRFGRLVMLCSCQKEKSVIGDALMPLDLSLPRIVTERPPRAVAHARGRAGAEI